MEGDKARVRRLFDEAAELAPTERAAFLDRECFGDPAVRERVDMLLKSLDGAGEFLAPYMPVPDSGSRVWEREGATPPYETAGTRIGPYKLLQQIGEGGFGIVFMAEQQTPFVRRVALKIIKLGMDTRHVIARFEAERQALALMDHPNIAQVLDAGATESGRPYFVMELIHGEPITTHCDRASLTTPERLALFVQVCQAVQHAHTKGIIHRDIKPSNVLVTMIDGRSVPKVIDFGIAKATAARLTERTLFTEFRQLVGTPEYMSPEQAAHSGVDIDTRSDVYSLGVLLYELLTGATPFDPRRLRSAAWDEMLRIIREDQPQKPSTRLSSMAEVIGSVAAHRRAVPSGLARLLRGDLDWITMKCLEKERSRRYETANGLAADVRRHLEGEPVLAAPPSPGYRLRKTVRRHARLFAAGAAVALGLAMFGGFAAVQAKRYADLAAVERRSRLIADDARSAAMTAGTQALCERDEAQRAQRAESDERQIAERESRRAHKVTEFLSETLGMADPDVAHSADVSMKAALDTVASRVAEVFGDDPESEASVRTRIGRAYATLGELERAQEHLERALSIRKDLNQNNPSKLLEVLEPCTSVLDESSDVLLWPHRFELLGVMQSVVGATHPELADAMSALRTDVPQTAEQYARLMRMAEAEQTPDDPAWLVLAQYLSIIADFLEYRDRHALACELLREVLAIHERLRSPASDSQVLSALGRLARSLIHADQRAQASIPARSALDGLGRILPPDHWRLALARARLAASTTEAERFEEAEAILVESHARIVDSRGPASVQAREILGYLIVLYDEWGRPKEAEEQRLALAAAQGPEYWTRLQSLRLAFGPEHVIVYDAFLRLEEEPAKEPGLTRANVDAFLAARRRYLPDDHPLGAILADQIAEWINRNQGIDLGERRLVLLREAERLARASTIMDPRKRSSVYWWLATELQSRGSLPEAESLARECLAIQEKSFGERGSFASISRSLLGACLRQQHRYAEAEPLLVKSFRDLLRDLGPADGNTQVALWNLIALYREGGRPREAISLFGACAEQSFHLANLMALGDTRFMLESVDARLPEYMQALRDGRNADAASLARLIDELQSARRGLFTDKEPIAVVYTTYLWAWADLSVADGLPEWVWEPVRRDALAVARAQLSASHSAVGNALFNLARSSIRRGDDEEGERLASEALAILREHMPEEHPHVAACKCLRAAALTGQARFQEAEDLFVPAYPIVLRGYGDLHHTTAFLLGAIVELYAQTGRPERAAEIIGPILQRVQVSEPDSPAAMARLSRVVVCRPGLGPGLYHQALSLAELAVCLKSDDADVLTTLGIAQYRLGRYQDAVGTLARTGQGVDHLPVMRTVFLAMANHHLGRVRESRAALGNARGLMQDLLNAVGRDNQAFLAEASALVESNDSANQPGSSH